MNNDATTVMGPTTLRYRQSPLTADYLRGGLGAVVSGLPLALVDVHWIPGVVFGAVFVIFVVFLLRTVIRQTTRIHLDEKGITVTGPFGKSLRWDSLTTLSLKYYSARRDRTDGWMTLRLVSPAAAISLESALDDFDSVVTAAASAANANGIDVDGVTRTNLAALGLYIRPNPDEFPEDDAESGQGGMGRGGTGQGGTGRGGWDWDSVRKDTRQ